jgi:hypothetical protein
VLALLVDLLLRIRFGCVSGVILAVLLALSINAAISGIIGVQFIQPASDLLGYQATVTYKANELGLAAQPGVGSKVPPVQRL